MEKNRKFLGALAACSPGKTLKSRSLRMNLRHEQEFLGRTQTSLNFGFVGVILVLNRTVVVDSDWRFDNLCRSHLQSHVRSYNRPGCRNVSHCQQQWSYSGLCSPGPSYSTLSYAFSISTLLQAGQRFQGGV